MALIPGASPNPESRLGVPTPESVSGQERETVEERPEAVEGTREEAAVVSETAPVAPVSTPVATSRQVTKDPVLLRVEEVMEEDMKETFYSMTPELRVKFKRQGEVTAEKIRKMLSSAKVKANKVLELIVAWLRIIPHVNRFFLEQEAKIKTDRIMALAEQKKDVV